MSNLKISYRCPSNIALIKYWGKKAEGIQLPANASISLTLSDLYAETTISAVDGNISGKPSFSLLLDGKPKKSFETKIQHFLERIWDQYSIVREMHLQIETSNNFPHGTGIASSAAGFGALALCISELEEEYTNGKYKHTVENASKIARLGSGSACRSVFGKPAVWGKHEYFDKSSDEYAIEFDYEIAFPLNQLNDAVLIIDAGEKTVSSSEGHGLLSGNPYAEARYKSATANLSKIAEALKKGNIHHFIHIVESEALQLHAMMMLSNPYYILMRPGTLAVIEKIWKFREQTGLPVMFTLDAGANVHVLYPDEYTEQIVNFIENELLLFCQNRTYLRSRTGRGPEKLTN